MVIVFWSYIIITFNWRTCFDSLLIPFHLVLFSEFLFSFFLLFVTVMKGCSSFSFVVFGVLYLVLVFLPVVVVHLMMFGFHLLMFVCLDVILVVVVVLISLFVLFAVRFLIHLLTFVVK